MAEKKIIRKVISKVSADPVIRAKDEAGEPEAETEKAPEAGLSRVEAGSPRFAGEAGKPKRACFFCQSKTSPTYTDINTLRRFLSDRTKIVPRAKSSLCSKHQRVVTRQIKYARHLSLLPFIPKV